MGQFSVTILAAAGSILSGNQQVEAFAQIDKEEIDPILSITTKAA
jgi:hypothetical protein